MDEKVPYIVFEGEMTRHERTIKRLVRTLVKTYAKSSRASREKCRAWMGV